MADNAQVPSSSERPIHERQGEEAATQQPNPDSANKKSGGDDAPPDEEKKVNQDPDKVKEMNAIAKGHHGDGPEGPGPKSLEEMKAAFEKK